jgi:excisionase family DNA binding protein
MSTDSRPTDRDQLVDVLAQVIAELLANQRIGEVLARMHPPVVPSPPAKPITDSHRPRLLKVPEASKLMGVSTSTIYAMIQRREIPFVRIGSATRLPEAELAAWVASKVENPVDPAGPARRIAPPSRSRT